MQRPIFKGKKETNVYSDIFSSFIFYIPSCFGKGGFLRYNESVDNIGLFKGEILMSITKEQEKSLQNFLLDTDTFHQLEKWTNNFNLFRVLSIEHMEIKHSNILAWLLDPNENHNLGDLFLSEFLKLLVQDEEKPFDILFLDPYTFSVYREESSKKESSKKESRMDILLISQEKNTEKGTIIVIENKIYSSESEGQLQKYKEGIEKKYPHYKKIFVFLTPDGRDGVDENWLPISYQNIYEILEKILQTHKGNLKKEVCLLLQNCQRL